MSIEKIEQVLQNGTIEDIFQALCANIREIMPATDETDQCILMLLDENKDKESLEAYPFHSILPPISGEHSPYDFPMKEVCKSFARRVLKAPTEPMLLADIKDSGYDASEVSKRYEHISILCTFVFACCGYSMVMYLDSKNHNFTPKNKKSLQDWVSKIQPLLKKHKVHLEEEIFHIKDPIPALIGNSPPLQQLKHDILRCARSDSNVLLLGETGTGKSYIAQIIHQLSNRSKCSYEPLNCSLIQGASGKSQLFGIARDRFTGVQESQGIFEDAQGGTVFLDEIGDLPSDEQAILNLVLDTKTVLRAGEIKRRTVDFRLISATLQNLQHSEFREDLYNRIAQVVITVPSLRDHAEDIPMLCDFFVKAYNQKRKGRQTIASDLKSYLQSQRWPGNVRQLQNVINRILQKTAVLRVMLADCPDIAKIIEESGKTYEKPASSENPSSPEKSPIPEARMTEEEYRISRLWSLYHQEANVDEMVRELSLSRATISPIRVAFRKIKENAELTEDQRNIATILQALKQKGVIRNM